MKMLTMNFSVDEMACPCCGKAEMVTAFMERLQALRDKLNKPLAITSGYRCLKHNTAIKGAAESKHLDGIACDIAVVNGADRHELVKAAFELGFTGVGIAKTFVHLDIRDGIKTIWLY